VLGIGQSGIGPDGSLTEGLTSNFFLVSAAGEVAANEGALNGTVREVLLQVRAIVGWLVWVPLSGTGLCAQVACPC
jgi:hypothetical protein